jgi:hypothetical protein
MTQLGHPTATPRPLLRARDLDLETDQGQSHGRRKPNG